MFVEANDVKPMSHAVLVSPQFSPPPAITYDHTSPYNGTCQVNKYSSFKLLPLHFVPIIIYIHVTVVMSDNRSDAMSQ